MNIALQNTALDAIAAAVSTAPAWLALLINESVISDLAGGSLPEAVGVTTSTAGNLTVWWTGATDLVAVSVTGTGTASSPMQDAAGTSFVLCTGCVDGDVITVVEALGTPTVAIASATEALARVVKVDAGDVVDAPVVVLTSPVVSRDWDKQGGWEASATLGGFFIFPQGSPATAAAGIASVHETVGLTCDQIAIESLAGLLSWEVGADEQAEALRMDQTSQRPGQVVVTVGWQLESAP